MSSTNSSSASGSAWQPLLRKTLAQLRAAHGADLDHADFITNEESFRDYFEAFARNLLEPRYTSLLVKLRHYWIFQWAGEVDRLERFVSPGSFVAVIWTTFSVVIEASKVRDASQSRQNLRDIVDILGQLNSAVPHIPFNLDHFQSDRSWRASLYQVIERYTGTLFAITSCIKAARTTSNGPPVPAANIQSLLNDATSVFNEQGEIVKQLPHRSAQFDTQYASSASARSGSIPVNELTPRFEVIKMLGNGSEGVVHKVKEQSTGQVFARKQVRVGSERSFSARTVEQVKKEVDVMERLQHIHIVTISFWTQDLEICSIYMKPCADMNLNVYLERCTENRYPTNLLNAILPWVGCLLTALLFAHNLNIWHQDVKPSNILVKGDQIFLSDFGEAKDFTGYETNRTRNDQVTGTPVYRAPEVEPGVERGPPADTFALGCVFSEMMTVLGKRSMQEYRQARSINNREEYAFRGNLGNVNAWINNLQSQMDGQVFDVLEYLIKRMIKQDQRSRHTPQELWEWLMKDKSHGRFHCRNHN